MTLYGQKLPASPLELRKITSIVLVLKYIHNIYYIILLTTAK